MRTWYRSAFRGNWIARLGDAVRVPYPFLACVLMEIALAVVGVLPGCTPAEKSPSQAEQAAVAVVQWHLRAVRLPAQAAYEDWKAVYRTMPEVFEGARVTRPYWELEEKFFAEGDFRGAWAMMSEQMARGSVGGTVFPTYLAALAQQGEWLGTVPTQHDWGRNELLQHFRAAALAYSKGDRETMRTVSRLAAVRNHSAVAGERDLQRWIMLLIARSLAEEERWDTAFDIFFQHVLGDKRDFAMVVGFEVHVLSLGAEIAEKSGHHRDAANLSKMLEYSLKPRDCSYDGTRRTNEARLKRLQTSPTSADDVGFPTKSGRAARVRCCPGGSEGAHYGATEVHAGVQGVGGQAGQ